MSSLGAAFAVLMVGHSLFALDGPAMLQGALRAGTGDGEVKAQIINGSPLRYNWENSHIAEGVDARAVLPEGGTTHLILTEALPLSSHIEWSETDVYGQAFARLAFSANPDAQVYVQETWHDLKSGTGVEVKFDPGADVPWRTRLDNDLPLWQDVVAKIAAGNPAHASQVHLIPAGQAMAQLYDEIAEGEIEGITDISVLFSDDIHLSDTGHYFVSMVQYATLTGQSPLGLPTDFSNSWGGAFDTPDPDLAREFQRIAWATVQSFQGAAPAAVPKTSTVPTPAAVAPAAPRAAPLTELPTTPAVDAAVQAEASAKGTNAIAIGLSSVVDWSTQQPLLDVFKTARQWIGHKPRQWGGMSEDELRAAGHLDADGWPIRLPRELGSIGTLILTQMPEEATSLAGRYVLRYSGKGIIEVAGRARNVRYGKGEVRFDYTPGPGSVDIRLQRINTSAPPRITSIVKEDMMRAYDRGQRFNPAWTTQLGAFQALRFMDWIETNNSKLSSWEARPKLSDYSYSKAVPIEVMIDLANTLEKDPWFTVPHLADDDFVRQFATLVKERLDPKLKAYVEFSNEVWNWGFEQAAWADDSAIARWGQKDKWMQYYGFRAAEVARIWTDVFAQEADARLINVISTHTGWTGLEGEALEASLVVAEGLPAPVTAFDAYAITGYFGGVLGGGDRTEMVNDWLTKSLAGAQQDAESKGLKGDAADAYVAKHRFDRATAFAARELRDGAISGDPADTVNDLVGRIFPYHAGLARKHGLSLIMYEGGTHVVGTRGRENDEALTAFFSHLNYTPEMGALYEVLLQGWKAAGGQLFNAYSDVGMPSKWGSWGALRHLDDSNPRWDALVNFQ
jgi:hypothetical protein